MSRRLDINVNSAPRIHRAGLENYREWFTMHILRDLSLTFKIIASPIHIYSNYKTYTLRMTLAFIWLSTGAGMYLHGNNHCSSEYSRILRCVGSVFCMIMLRSYEFDIPLQKRSIRSKVVTPKTFRTKRRNMPKII